MNKFVMEFDGEIIRENGIWLECKEKNVKISKHILIDFVKENLPLQTKKCVGIVISDSIALRMGQERFCYAHRDQDYVHIGCLKETKESFNKKYVQLIKHLNQDKHVDPKQGSSSTC